MYKTLLRPWLFRMDAEKAHRTSMGLGHFLQALPLPNEAIRSHYLTNDRRLSQTLWGQTFSSPLGLAAGMDKNAEFIEMWQMFGLGFLEVGSVTARLSEGNAAPRLFRLPGDKALINRMGLNNEGASRVAANVRQSQYIRSVPLGINIAKTHDPSIVGQDAIDDFVECYRELSSLADYVALNISCPNTEEGKTFEEPESLAALLSAIGSIREEEENAPPLLVKLSPPPTDIWQPDAAFDDLCAVLLEHAVDGVILSNTSPNRRGLSASRAAIDELGAGGVSGRPLFRRAVRMTSLMYAKTEGKLPLIGVGGVDSADAVYELMKAGASLVQMYTALVYEGPGLIRSIHMDLLERMTRDDLGSISEIVGMNA